jgi:hypothetical protein
MKLGALTDEDLRRLSQLGLSVPLLAWQFAVWMISTLVLDCGVLLRAFTVGFVAYWVGLVLIAVRREGRTRPSDRWFGRFGWIPLLVLSTLGHKWLGTYGAISAF